MPCRFQWKHSLWNAAWAMYKTSWLFCPAIQRMIEPAVPRIKLTTRIVVGFLEMSNENRNEASGFRRSCCSRWSRWSWWRSRHCSGRERSVWYIWDPSVAFVRLAVEGVDAIQDTVVTKVEDSVGGVYPTEELFASAVGTVQLCSLANKLQLHKLQSGQWHWRHLKHSAWN